MTPVDPGVSPRRSSGRTLAILALTGLLAPATTLAGLWFLGGLDQTVPVGLPDAGTITHWAEPIASVMRDLAATITVGALVVASLCLPAESAALRRLRFLGALAGGLWVWISVVTLAFTYSEVAAIPLSSPGIGAQIWSFATDFDLGRYLMFSTLLAAAATVTAWCARTIVGTGLSALCALAALWPLALTGHAAGSANHALAVESQAFHLLGAGVWAGGLVAVLVAAPRLGERAALVRRYSVIAGGCFAAVALSGIGNAVLRVPSWTALASSYGAVLGVKAVALISLGAAGLLQRRRLIAAIAVGSTSAFRRLALSEVAVMAVAIGAGAALARSAPPGLSDEATLTGPAAVLGAAIPPRLTALRWLTQWNPEVLWLAIAVGAICWYLRSVRRLRGRGDAWSRGRTTAWTLGWVILIWATSGAPGTYGRVLFSMHMVQHMTIATFIPTLLVLGAPITLLMRTSPARQDGSYGPREWVLTLVRSPYLQILSFPVVSAGLFIVSLVTFYTSGLFEASMRSHTLHLLMVLHFLLVGYLLASALVGIDPGAPRPPYPMRIMLVMVVFGVHALYSVSLLSTSSILAGPWFRLVHPPWAASLASDQHLGASLGWALGDFPLALLAAVIMGQWVAADRRERRRLDRCRRRSKTEQFRR